MAFQAQLRARGVRVRHAHVGFCVLSRRLPLRIAGPCSPAMPSVASPAALNGAKCMPCAPCSLPNQVCPENTPPPSPTRYALNASLTHQPHLLEDPKLQARMKISARKGKRNWCTDCVPSLCWAHALSWCAEGPPAEGVPDLKYPK